MLASVASRRSGCWTCTARPRRPRLPRPARCADHPRCRYDLAPAGCADARISIRAVHLRARRAPPRRRWAQKLEASSMSPAVIAVGVPRYNESSATEPPDRPGTASVRGSGTIGWSPGRHRADLADPAPEGQGSSTSRKIAVAPGRSGCSRQRGAARSKYWSIVPTRAAVPAQGGSRGGRSRAREFSGPAALRLTTAVTSRRARRGPSLDHRGRRRRRPRRTVRHHTIATACPHRGAPRPEPTSSPLRRTHRLHHRHQRREDGPRSRPRRSAGLEPHRPDRLPLYQHIARAR